MAKRGPKPAPKMAEEEIKINQDGHSFEPSIKARQRALELYDELLPPVKEKLITSVDVNLFVRYCEALALVEEIEEYIDGMTGDPYVYLNDVGGEVARPIWAILDKVEARLCRLADKLGLNPSARKNLLKKAQVIPPAGEQSPEKDELATARARLESKARGEKPRRKYNDITGDTGTV